jgi:hypothetical protein
MQEASLLTLPCIESSQSYPDQSSVPGATAKESKQSQLTVRQPLSIGMANRESVAWRCLEHLFEGASTRRLPVNRRVRQRVDGSPHVCRMIIGLSDACSASSLIKPGSWATTKFRTAQECRFASRDNNQYAKPNPWLWIVDERARREHVCGKHG